MMFNMNFGDFGMGFSLFSILFYVIFVVVIGTFVVTFIKGIKQWNKNNNSPHLTVDATVVSKRTNVSHHHHGGEHHHSSSSTTYYVTFEVASGDRMELKMAGHEYGMLVEGDRGQLSFQGTRYLGFQRN